MKESGCVSVYYGIESGNEEILQTMSKRTTLEQVREAVRLTRESGIHTDYGLMFGQPSEDAETLRHSVEVVKELAYGDYAAKKIFGCIPFPGTGLYAWCKQTGRIKDDEDFYNRYICQDWSLDQLPVNMTELPDDEARRLFSTANEELNLFFRERMSVAWLQAFGGDLEGLGHRDSLDDLSHIGSRIEANLNTQDVSGRSGQASQVCPERPCPSSSTRKRIARREWHSSCHSPVISGPKKPGRSSPATSSDETTGPHPYRQRQLRSRSCGPTCAVRAGIAAKRLRRRLRALWWKGDGRDPPTSARHSAGWQTAGDLEHLLFVNVAPGVSDRAK